MLINNYKTNLRNIPDYFVWIKYLSWFYYTNENTNILLWRKVNSIDCSAGPLNGSCAVSTCFKDGQSVLDANGFKKSNLARNFALMGVIYLVLQILCFVFLKLKLKFAR